MAKFNEYPAKTTPKDADKFMIYSAEDAANKLSPFSGIWNWMVNKLTNAVINNLQTSNKTVVGALNELNSNSSRVENRIQFEWHNKDEKYPSGLKLVVDKTTTLLLPIESFVKME